MAFAFGDHVLDVERREFADRPSRTQTPGLSALIYLASHRARVVSKGDLIENVWDGRIVSVSTVTTRLNEARRAVGEA